MSNFVECTIKSGIDPLSFSLGREQKMLGFFASFEAYKKAGFLRKGKNGHNVFRTGAEIHFSETNILGLGALLDSSLRDLLVAMIQLFHRFSSTINLPFSSPRTSWSLALDIACAADFSSPFILEKHKITNVSS